jgi:hypothetical protein
MNLGEACRVLGKSNEARKWFGRGYTTCRRYFGEDHPTTLEAAEALKRVEENQSPREDRCVVG